MDFSTRRLLLEVASTNGDSLSTLEIVILVVAAFVVGFAAGRVLSLRRNTG